jgi:hypothetical protein
MIFSPIKLKTIIAENFISTGSRMPIRGAFNCSVSLKDIPSTIILSKPCSH